MDSHRVYGKPQMFDGELCVECSMQTSVNGKQYTLVCRQRLAGFSVEALWREADKMFNKSSKTGHAWLT